MLKMLQNPNRTSVCPVSMIYSKTKSRGQFKFGEDMTLDMSNMESKFEVSRSKVKVTTN